MLEKFLGVIAIIFLTYVSYRTVKLFITYLKDVKLIKQRTSFDHIHTGDFRIWSFYSRCTFWCLGDNFQNAKFEFSENEVFLFLRNSFPTYYNSPIVIKTNRKEDYSILSQYVISEIRFSLNEIKLCVKQPYFFGNKYCMTFVDFTESDKLLLLKYLKKEEKRNIQS
jgi:hypothetical protein